MVRFFSPTHFPDLLRHLSRQVEVNQHIFPLQIFQLNDPLGLKKIFANSLLCLFDLLAYESSILFIHGVRLLGLERLEIPFVLQNRQDVTKRIPKISASVLNSLQGVSPARVR